MPHSMSAALQLASALCIVSVIALSGCNPSVAVDSRKCEQVTSGMTTIEVIEIMGEPRYRSDGHPASQSVKFSYSEPAFASGPISITFREQAEGELLVDYKACDGEP